MRVLIIGAGGQLGTELQRTASQDIELIAAGRDRIDLETETFQATIHALAPDCIINAAAYTAVDAAETEASTAFRVNRDGVALLAASAVAIGAPLVHVSTDFVFDGQQSTPYPPDATLSPLGVYGGSKAAGEEAVRRLAPDSHLIVRTAWLYEAGGQNFVNTMLRLMRERDKLRVVCDQVGTPTRARSLAKALWRCVERQLRGTEHWTSAGIASWYDFAVAIQEESLAIGLLDRAIPIEPIASAEFPTRARRPAFSVLDNRRLRERTGLAAVHWRADLRAMLRNIINA